MSGLPDIRHSKTFPLPAAAGPSFSPRRNAEGMERRVAHQSFRLAAFPFENAGASRRSIAAF
jgi:hypothetical protein